MQYTTTINTESEYGITAAREAYNASLPATVKDGETDVPNPALISSDSAYLDFVLTRAIESWCKMYAPVVVPRFRRLKSMGCRNKSLAARPRP